MCVSNCDVKCIFYHLLKNQNTESFAHHNYFAFCLFCLEDLLHIILFFVSSTNSNSLFKTQLLWSLNQTFTICSVQFNSVAQSCPTLCNPMNHSMPGLPIHHQLPESTQTHVHRVGDAIQPSHPQSSPSLPAPYPSRHQGLFQWVNSSHEVAKVLEFQLQHQSFQWTPRPDLL